jgi:hypothetical protein
MSWRAITETDILQRLSGDELTALRAAALASDQADPVAGEISAVTELIRGYVGACASNTLGAAGTIPERLMAAAADILAVRIPTRAAGTLIDPESARSRAQTGAIRLLEQVAECKFSVDVPTSGTESTEDTAAASPSITERDLSLTRTNQDGI